MESIAVWQGATLGGIVAWILISSYLNVTRKLRSFLQPWVAHHVIAGRWDSSHLPDPGFIQLLQL